MLAAAGLAFSAVAQAAEEADAPPTQADRGRGNICFGGFEHGKLIPADDRVANPFTQTTLLGCSVEGGTPTFLPDLKPKVAGGVMS